VALVQYLQSLNFTLIDCQISTDHLIRFGAREISRTRYLRELEEGLKAPTLRGKWVLDSSQPVSPV
jgi:leucyl/phenylalanyl-tRNA--protein transferase